MGLLEQLQEQGWHLLPAGIERLLEGTPGTSLDVKQAIKLALDIDLREIGGGALSSISARGTKADSIDGNIVVQVMKVRNISAPKANEESKAAPRLLKLTITDGQTQYSALEGEHVSSLSLDTAPGTKLYLKNGPIKISQGLLILNANNVSILGGKVPALVEKWELGRAMAKYAKGGRMQLSASGPPPWIPFGQKIQQQNVPVADKNFKSLQTKEKDESKENAEFTALRNDAIAEANKLGTKKTFGGGAKQMVDANVQKIMDKGFSEEQANHALKLSRNNVQRALSNLQRIEDRKQQNQPSCGEGDYKTGKLAEPPQKLGKPTFRGKRDSESDALAKPSAKVSLFDFLEDILPETDASANKKSSSKESTPFGGKDGKSGVDSYTSKQSGGYNSYSSSNPNNRTSNSAPSGGNPSYQSNSSSGYNSANKSYNQQRFENNISSSFANRNTHPGPNNRSYGQQNPQQQQQNSNTSGGYKQQSYDYNNSRGYRGGPPNATGSGYTSEGHPRGGRPESKYNQSHSSYNNPHQQNQQQYRNDSYNNNSSSSNSNATTGPQSSNSKYASNSGSGKSQPPTNNSSYYAEGGRGSQNYNGQADGGGRKHPGYQQQSQQQQQSSYQGSKPVQGYNATGGSVGNHTGAHQSNAANNNHYGQHGASNNYNNSNSTQGPKPAKGSRYTKEESQKFSGPPPKSSTTPPSQQARNPPGQQPPQSQKPQHGSTPSGAGGMQPPFVPGNKQPSPGPPGSNSNNAAKMAQLTEATAGMQIGNSKQFNNNSQQVMPGKPHQQGPMVSGPPPHPAPATTPVVPKNYIQLPNGFNYNPYQIMGFQNKQTNEFALNVLKSQQFDALQTAHLAAAGPPGGPPVQAVAGPIPGVPMPGTATVLTPAGPAMPAGAGGVLPNWKIGDRCLAKYWEDGGFYNAEITAISENTFVVCFLEYGNYEEVLKTDCIPLTGAPAGPPPPATIGFHHPQAALGVQPHPAMMAPHPPPPTGAYPVQGAADSQSAAVAQQHFNPGGGYKPQPSQYPPHPHHGHPQQQPPPPPHHQQQRPSKFREQRPMYVPPAQRK